MTELSSRSPLPDAPGMGERWARSGYGYQDKVATERILDSLRRELIDRSGDFEGVRLADLQAGRVDDLVLVRKGSIEGNSIRWSAAETDWRWRDLIGKSGLLRELADGWTRLRDHWTRRTITVRLHTNQPASNATHHAQLIPSFSVAEFVDKYWHLGPDAADSHEVREAWDKIAEHVGLAGSELSDFVAHCLLTFGHAEPPEVGPDTLDRKYYLKQFDRLHKAIATWLTNHPDHEFIERDYLLEAIGPHLKRPGLIQRFPEPDIPYEKNHAAADSLKALVDATPGGYIAITGVAGTGKSTLVQDVVTDSTHPYFFPYYAFLPSTEGNRDRAEALTFFQDVVARLDRIDPTRSSLGVSDVAQGRDALRWHMSSANQRYVLDGHKTILLIDGLDHVMREAGLQTPVLNELPHPSEVPEGFLIILSSQPQALLAGVVPPAVAATIAEDGRRLEVDGLSRAEVHRLVSKLSRSTTGEERDLLHGASLGNPLILTYLLLLLERSGNGSVTEAIALAGDYEGDIEQYYQERLSTPLQDGETRRLLGLLCRAAPTLRVNWLTKWPEKEAIEDIYQRLLAPFVRVDGDLLTFIHDSLVSFLKSETRSRLPGSNAKEDERRYYSSLADRSNGRPCLDPVGRARVVFLTRANRHTDVLEQVSSDWLRAGMHGFLPYAHLSPILLAGHAAASALGRWDETLRLLLLSHELEQRTSRIDAARLANFLLTVDDPDLALSQIKSENQLLVDGSDALRFAGTMHRYARQRNRSKFIRSARSLYRQAKPISIIYNNKPINAARPGDDFETVRAWSSVAPLFERPDVVAEEIQRLALSSASNSHEPDPVAVRAHLLFRALTAALDAGYDLAQCHIFVKAIQLLGSDTWHFAAMLRLAESMPLEVDIDSLGVIHEVSETDDDVDLAYAWFLHRQGDREGATEIVSRLPHIRFELRQHGHSWGFSDLTYTIRLRWLQEILGLPESEIPQAEDEREEARLRVEHVARRLGSLMAIAEKGEVPGDYMELFRSLLHFHNRPIQFSTQGSHSDPIAQVSRTSVYEQVARLARAMGQRGLCALRDVVLELTSLGSVGEQFLPIHRRQFAQLFAEVGVMSKGQAVALGLSTTRDASDDDPSLRQEACLEIATFLHRVGDQTESEKWKRKATEVSAGAGRHEDYHMARVADWLARSVTHPATEQLAILDQCARTVEVSGGSGGTDGAAKLLRLLVRLTPERAWRLAVEYLDRGVLNMSTVLAALLAGGVDARAHPELLSAVYGELHSLIAPDDTSEAAATVLSAFPRDQMRKAGEQLMAYVRTNVLPSHRAPVARALEDVTRKRGIEPSPLTAGLGPGRDDSSRESTLYRLVTGEVQTLDQMAERLSDPNRPDAWNPHPEDNADFDWWTAIEKANIVDEEHFDNLVGKFPPPDYREVRVLARKAHVVLSSGDRHSAKVIIEKAIARSRDGSWHRWLDGAEKTIVYGMLKRIDHADGVARARDRFSKDLSAGKLSPSYLLSDIGNIMELMDVDWPSDAALEAVSDYLAQVLAANPQSEPYGALTGSALSWSADQGLCRFVAELLAFPVVDVAVAARRALAKYLSADGRAFVALLTDSHWWNPTQLEHLLVAAHMGMLTGSPRVEDLRPFVEHLNHSESLSVRSIAKRICDEQSWDWEDVTTAPAQPVILLPGYKSTPRETDMVIGGDTAIAWDLHQGLIRPLLARGLDEDELRSEFEGLYWAVRRAYPWADDGRLQQWMKLLLTRFWLRPQAIIGREAAMRVFGRQSLSGQVPPGAEIGYDTFYPIYDKQLELHQATKRPPGLQAMEWSFTDNDRELWFEGADAGEWSHYPNSIQGLSLIGERTWLVRPEWELTREERYRGLVRGSASDLNEQVLKSALPLTYQVYLNGWGQGNAQLIVLNTENQLVGPAYRWAAINSNLARALGWRPSASVPFQWLDPAGEVMVESTYWKDGWRWIAPPCSDSLGEGWFVSASTNAIEAIRRFAPETEIHLWVERHSHGEREQENKWHLSRPL